MRLLRARTATGTADEPGSVSRDAPFGVHVGRRMDGWACFTGAIAGVRVSATGRSPTQVAAAAQRLAGSSADTVPWLPMDQVGAGR